MTRLLISTLASFLVVSILPSQSANASNLDCPISWTIDTSIYPNEELEKLIESYGKNIAVERIPQYIDKNGNWKAVQPFYDSLNEATLRFLWLKANSWRVIFEIEVINCDKHILIFNEPVRPLQVVEHDIDDYIKNNMEKFKNFKVAENYPKYISSVKLKTLEAASNLSKKKNLNEIALPVQDLFFFDAGCGTEMLDSRNLKLKKGANCLVGIGQQNYVEKNIKIFEKFNINTNYRQSTIYCKKGNLSKKVTGLNAKCPKGYSAKM